MNRLLVSFFIIAGKGLEKQTPFDQNKDPHPLNKVYIYEPVILEKNIVLILGFSFSFSRDVNEPHDVVFTRDSADCNYLRTYNERPQSCM